MLFLARTDDEEIHAEVLPALCTLSFADANKIEICKHGGLEPVVSLLTHRDGMLARQACCALANLAEEVENQANIVQRGAIPKLIEALEDSTSLDVKRKWLVAAAL